MDHLPSLTLRQIRAQGLADRRVVLAAREHVGMAGLEQTAALERIVAVGRSQPGISRALEQIAQSLQAPETGTVQLDTDELLEASREQLEMVRQVEQVVTLALQAVTSTPVDQISVEVLGEINQSAQAQLVTLERLIHDVQQRSQSQAQIDLLEDVNAQVHEEIEAIEVREATGQLESLRLVSQQAVAQMAALSQAPSQQQITALNDLADAARAQADALSAQAADGQETEP
ncbi:hypothetical protein [Deinococcus sonorensis]|uniref:Methyl-accepting transducer domain-containing protein n=2 Tax=Deinococcus sonorensis TaxID=309891 RepID=A0AAU7UCH9_9DEIO